MDAQFPDDHRVGLLLQIDGDVPVLVGTARSGADLPRLLNAIAKRWVINDGPVVELPDDSQWVVELVDLLVPPAD